MKLLLVLAIISLALSQMGGYFPCEANDQNSKMKAALVTVSTLSRKDGIDYQLVGVTKCQKQLVNGVNYKLNVELSAVGFNSIKKTVIVYEPFNSPNALELVSVEDLEDEPFGTYVNCDMTTANSINGLMYALEEINKRKNSYYRLYLDEVLEAKCQVVNGLNMKMKLKLRGSPDGSTEIKEVTLHEEFGSGNNRDNWSLEIKKA